MNGCANDGTDAATTVSSWLQMRTYDAHNLDGGGRDVAEV
jgi:hypothetical protein